MLLFFFKQKTAYEMRISDWSSDVCSSDLLETQAYRVAFWRVASSEINYRRFFDINDLAGIRVELPEVFDAIHRLVFRWIADGKVEGLRLDHIDGLFDPQQYCARLQAHAGALSGGIPYYILVEKILAPHESLPEDWRSEEHTSELQSL